MNKPLIWAHRGASAYAPENTIPAFQKAIEMKADGVELDIQLTKDDRIVVIHDETIDRTSTGSGWVKDMTLAELRKFNYNKTHPEFEHADIPTMDEVLDLLKPTDLTIDIELKTGIVFYDHLEEKILALVKEKGMEDRVNYSSFNHYTCRRIKELKKDAYVGFLYADGPIDMPAYAKKYGMDAINPAVYNLQYPDVAKDCAKKSLDINVWTVDEPEHIRKCIDLGVKTIITNRPDTTREVAETYVFENDSFNDLLTNQIKPWLKEHIVSKDLLTGDGTRIRYYYALNPDAKASITFVHGFCEFFGKYHEVMYRFYQAGYSVFFLELRGYGKSARVAKEKDIVYVGSYNEYMDDIYSFSHQIVFPLTPEDRHILFGHSMGGCLTAMYLEKYPEEYEAGIMSSPMIQLDFGGWHLPVIKTLAAATKVTHRDMMLLPNQKRFDGIRDFKNSNTLSEIRFNYQFDQRLADEDYQTRAGTAGWLNASLHGMDYVIKHTADIQVPLLVLEAGQDKMVVNEATDELVKKIPSAILHLFPESRHEIYYSNEKEREEWFTIILDFLKKTEAQQA